jgi:hypothetical protein
MSTWPAHKSCNIFGSDCATAPGAFDRNGPHWSYHGISVRHDIENCLDKTTHMWSNSYSCANRMFGLIPLTADRDMTPFGHSFLGHCKFGFRPLSRLPPANSSANSSLPPVFVGPCKCLCSHNTTVFLHPLRRGQLISDFRW